MAFIIGNLGLMASADQLKNMVEFIVFVRENDFDIHSLDCLKEKGYNFKFAQMPFIDMSSTELRNKIKNKLSSLFFFTFCYIIASVSKEIVL